MWSVQIMALVAVVQGVWAQIPDDIKASLPPTFIQWLTAGLTVAGIAVRVIQQSGLLVDQPEPPADKAPKP
jgi:protein-S-isoprenylcysteine O-methyltransferase Ste14